MSKHYCIKVSNCQFTCIAVKKRLSSLQILEEIEFDSLEQLLQFSQKKSNVNIALFDPNIIQTSIETQKSIDDINIIQTLVKQKFQKEQIEIDDLLLIYDKIDTNTNKELNKYNIYGINSNLELYQKFINSIELKHHTNITMVPFALYLMAKQYFKEENFISIYMTEDVLSVVAGHPLDLFYSRSIYLKKQSAGDLDYYKNEILKNIAYIQENLRDITFNTITINGILFEDEAINEIEASTNIKTINLKPTLNGYKSITNEQFNKYLIELSNVDLDKTFNLISKDLKEKRAFFNMLNVQQVILLVVLGYFLFATFNSYTQHDELHTKQNQLIEKINSISSNQIKQSELIEVNNFVNMMKNYDSVDILSFYDSTIKTMQKINESKYKFNLKFDLTNQYYTLKTPYITLKEFKFFQTLFELNKFEKDMKLLQEELQDKVEMKITVDEKKLQSTVYFIFKGLK